MELDERSRSRLSGRRRGVPSESADSCPPYLRPTLLSRMSKTEVRPLVALQPRGSRVHALDSSPYLAPSRLSPALARDAAGQVEAHEDRPRPCGATRRGARLAEEAQPRLEGLNVPRLVPKGSKVPRLA